MSLCGVESPYDMNNVSHNVIKYISSVFLK